jgi:hypothetical protein
MRRAARLAVVCALLATAHAAVAAGPSKVVLLRGGAGASGDEALNRLRAELAAAGFTVEVASPAPGEDPRSAVERAAREAGAFAAVMASPSSAGTAADIWVTDRVTGKTSVRRVEVRGATAPADLAVRAVDLLQASLLEATAAAPPSPQRAPPKPPPDVARWVDPPRPPRPFFAGLVLEAAAGLLHSTGGIGPAVCPSLRLSFGWRDTFGLRLGFAGPAASAPLESPLGSATVRQELASLDAFYALDGRWPFIPFVSVGAGVYHLFATGAPKPPYIGASADIWAAAASVGLGGAYRLTERVALAVDARGLLIAPRPVVTLAGEPLGSAGRPSILVTAGVLASLF